jgi:hypothetical protein
MASIFKLEKWVEKESSKQSLLLLLDREDRYVFPETSVDFHRTVQNYIPEDRPPPHTHLCENSKSTIIITG